MTHYKDPAERLDYVIDWSEWLQESSDTIASAVCTYSGVTEYVAPIVTTTAVRIWVHGGTARTNASVTCTVTTAAGRIGERTIGIRVRDR